MTKADSVSRKLEKFSRKTSIFLSPAIGKNFSFCEANAFTFIANFSPGLRCVTKCLKPRQPTKMIYHDQIHSADQALVHLAFHCSLKDGQLQKEELDFLSSTFVSKGLNKELSIKNEMEHYQSYKSAIKDESDYLHFLVETIHPENKLALFAFCAEIICRDNNISISEEVLLNKIASLLYIKDAENLTIQNLITEMNEVERRNAF